MHVQSCCFAVLARWRRRCCLISPTYNETTPSWINKNYACATGSSPLEDHYRTEKSDCSWFKTWYAELNSPPSRATTVNSPTDSFLYSMFCWHYVNECRDTRGNRGEIAPEQKSPTYYVNTAKTVGSVTKCSFRDQSTERAPCYVRHFPQRKSRMKGQPEVVARVISHSVS